MWRQSHQYKRDVSNTQTRRRRLVRAVDEEEARERRARVQLHKRLARTRQQSGDPQ